jgi:hypothetical protein
MGCGSDLDSTERGAFLCSSVTLPRTPGTFESPPDILEQRLFVSLASLERLENDDVVWTEDDNHFRPVAVPEVQFAVFVIRLGPLAPERYVLILGWACRPARPSSIVARGTTKYRLNVLQCHPRTDAVEAVSCDPRPADMCMPPHQGTCQHRGDDKSLPLHLTLESSDAPRVFVDPGNPEATRPSGKVTSWESSSRPTFA